MGERGWSSARHGHGQPTHWPGQAVQVVAFTPMWLAAVAGGGWATHWEDTDIALSGLHSNTCLSKPDRIWGSGPFFSEVGLTLSL